jgi:hypothetical protein
VSYRLLDEEVLAPEIGEMRGLIARNQAALSLCSGSAISSRKKMVDEAAWFRLRSDITTKARDFRLIHGDP